MESIIGDQLVKYFVIIIIYFKQYYLLREPIAPGQHQDLILRGLIYSETEDLSYQLLHFFNHINNDKSIILDS